MKPTMPWEEAAWPWAAAVLLIGLDLAGMAVAHFALGWNVWGQGPAHELDSPGQAVLGNWSLATRAALGLAFLFFCLWRGVPVRATGLRLDDLRLRAWRFAKALGIVVGVFLLLSVTSIVVYRVAGRADEIRSPVQFFDAGSRLGWILVFVVALPPLEEFLYRGVLHTTLRRRLGAGAAVVAGGLLFWLLHLFYGIPLEGSVGYAAAGMMLAWLYEKTGSLLFSWIVHVITNLAGAFISEFPGLFEWLRG